jgi:nicotinate-nucleotide pyrophosphorylase (carboxylating)
MNNSDVKRARILPRVPVRYLLSFIGEDAPFGDITTTLVIPEVHCEAVIIAKGEGIIAGLEEAMQLFSYFNIEVNQSHADGSMVKKGDILLTLHGKASLILLLERTVLNIIGRMSGISTKTRDFIDILSRSGAKCRVAATRKTVPGFRLLDKKAVMLGGGDAHRFSLSDGILIKDNHLAIIPLKDAVSNAKINSVYRKIEVEVESTDMAVIAAESGAEILLFDNMTPEKIVLTLSELERRGLRKDRLIEISGSIDEHTIIDYAIPGVDIISIGALTHSVRNFDVSLEIIKQHRSSDT